MHTKNIVRSDVFCLLKAKRLLPRKYLMCIAKVVKCSTVAGGQVVYVRLACEVSMLGTNEKEVVEIS